MPSKTFRKRRFSKKRSASKVTSKKAIVKLIKKEIVQEAEVKFVDTFTPLAALTFYQEWNLYSFQYPAVGTSDSGRIGDQIRTLSMDFRIQFIPPNISSCARFIIFRWHPVGIPSLNAIILTPIPSAVNQNCILATTNRDQRTQFTILSDTTVPLGQYIVAGGGVNTINRVIHKRIKYKSLVQFQGGGATGTNLIYMIICCDSATSPQLSFSSRLLYIDV